MPTSRRIRGIARFALMTLLVKFLCFAQTNFERENKEALDRNSPGLRVSLRTQDGRGIFHLFETIPIELDFTSTHAPDYSIELDEVMNFAGQTNRFEAFPGDTILLPAPVGSSRGVVCCETHRRYLSSQPTILKRELTDYLRFERPGTYSVSYVTNRVFRGLGKKDDFGASPLTLTSNILTLTILADDPEWDSHRLADVLAKLNDPQLRVNYVAAANHVNNLKSETAQNVARDNRLQRTEFVLAQKALNALDTDQAIRERIKLMQMESKSDLDSARQFNTCTQLVQPLLRSTTRADQVVAAMKARAEQPEFAVDCNYVQLWARFLVQRDHPELFRSAETGYSEIQKQLRNYVAYHSGAKRELVELLESLLPSKTGKAAETTAITIQVVKEFSTHETTPR